MSGAFDAIAKLDEMERQDWPPAMRRDWLAGWIRDMESDRAVFGLTPAEEANVKAAKARLATLEAEVQQ